MPFEWRKAAHSLAIVWGVAVCFHAPKQYVGYIMGTAVGVYALDTVYDWCFQIHHVETVQFTRLGTAVEIVWERSKALSSHCEGVSFVGRSASSRPRGLPAEASLVPSKTIMKRLEFGESLACTVFWLCAASSAHGSVAARIRGKLTICI